MHSPECSLADTSCPHIHSRNIKAKKPLGGPLSEERKDWVIVVVNQMRDNFGIGDTSFVIPSPRLYLHASDEHARFLYSRVTSSSAIMEAGQAYESAQAKTAKQINRLKARGEKVAAASAVGNVDVVAARNALTVLIKHKYDKRHNSLA